MISHINTSFFHTLFFEKLLKLIFVVALFSKLYLAQNSLKLNIFIKMKSSKLCFTSQKVYAYSTSKRYEYFWNAQSDFWSLIILLEKTVILHDMQFYVCKKKNHFQYVFHFRYFMHIWRQNGMNYLFLVCSKWLLIFEHTKNR